MLCQFIVKNFKSILDDATLDMQAVSISEREDRIISGAGGEKYLPVAVLYGSNGAGKSNVLLAIKALIGKVMKPVYAVRDTKMSLTLLPNAMIKPFLFSEEGRINPTEFEIFFRTLAAEYRYVLCVKDDIVLYESLDWIKLNTGRKRKSALILRKGKNVEMKGDFARLKINNSVSDSLPVLSFLGIVYRNNDIVRDVLNWFETKVQFINNGSSIQEMHLKIAESEAVKKLVIAMFREMDLEIEDFRVEWDGDKVKDIYVRHTVDGNSMELRLQDESSGIQKLFGMIPDILWSLRRGSTLIVDELDAKIHPILLRHIIMMYTDQEINRNGAQLIFTSHDLSTMNNETFRRDEIWFVAKGEHQESMLYSLVEFKNEDGNTVRKDARYDKQYLEGRYGADPCLRKIIDWSDINKRMKGDEKYA